MWALLPRGAASTELRPSDYGPVLHDFAMQLAAQNLFYEAMMVGKGKGWRIFEFGRGRYLLTTGVTAVL